ncbi:MAG: Sulfite oxidase, partial [Myxococcaceae bacterium]|nr:Sulfite oxidase [Myxococcaceae bacterium]
MKKSPSPLLRPTMLDRRTFLRGLTVGTVVVGVGGTTYVLADDEATKRARAQLRPDGRSRLPPDQYLLHRMRPMGGTEGDPSPGKFRLKIS